MKYTVVVEKDNTIVSNDDFYNVIEKMKLSLISKIVEENLNPEEYLLTLHNEEIELIMTAEKYNNGL